MKLSRSLLQTFVLLLACTICHAGDLTGYWVRKGAADSGMWLKTHQTGQHVRFQLELARGAPSYNSGWIEGEFSATGAFGVFQSAEMNCEIHFRFSPVSVQLSEVDEKRDCGFGYNVHAEGTLMRTSRKKPAFNTSDPRVDD